MFVTDPVLYQRRGHLAIITMNRPERLNTMNQALVEGLAWSWRRYQQDDEAWIAILNGNGRTFCAGLDIKDRAERGDTGLNRPGSSVRDPYWHGEMEKPTIAAVHGYAYGGGFFLAERADLRLAEESARFQITEVIRGGLAGYQMETYQNLPSAIAAELAVGDVLTARRAYDVGFVNRVVPDGQALEAAIAWAESILERPPLTVDYNLRLTRRMRNRRIPEDIFRQAKAWQAELVAGHDVNESFRAFLEKRKPVYRRG